MATAFLGQGTAAAPLEPPSDREADQGTPQVEETAPGEDASVTSGSDRTHVCDRPGSPTWCVFVDTERGCVGAGWFYPEDDDRTEDTWSYPCDLYYLFEDDPRLAEASAGTVGAEPIPGEDTSFTSSNRIYVCDRPGSPTWCVFVDTEKGCVGAGWFYEDDPEWTESYPCDLYYFFDGNPTDIRHQ